MKKKNNPFKHFSKFVLRTPSLNFNFYEELTAGNCISNDQLIKAYNDPLIKEACFLASPALYFEAEKWLKGGLDKKKEEKIQFSLLKYLTRMSTRCTPFGLFAGCSLGGFNTNTSIIPSTGNNKRHTRFDMNYLVALSHDLSKQKSIRKQLFFVLNSSLYISGNQLRYIEYYYVNSRRHHHIVELDNSEYLSLILKKAKSGVLYSELISSLIDVGISNNDAENFIDELLDSQVLVSNLEPSVSGPEFMEQILEVLENLKGVDREIQFLKNLQNKLNEIDECLGNAPHKYFEISASLKEKTTSFELKHLFQSDLELRPKENLLSFDVAETLKRGMKVLNRLTSPKSETNLSKFKNIFYERYEEREMPLARVLDVETGIGYIQDWQGGDLNPLVDDVFLPLEEDWYGKRSVEQDNINRLLERKLISSNQKGETKIIISDDDIIDLPENWDDLPDTLSTMIKIIREDGQEKIKFSSIGGSSAANLLGRFCYGDKALKTFSQHITDLENKINFNKILAEIVHLPEARVGNILMRPAFRKFEIPYLAKSVLAKENQIPLEDLFISVRNDKMILRSKKLDKEVVPHLTNAHFFSANALPIYHFLCDMQTQNLRSNIYFSYGYLEENRSFLPRVEYGNLILSEAKWRVKKDEILNLLQIRDNNLELREAVEKWRKKIKLPRYVLLSEGDNQLLINFNNITSVKMFLDEVKNKNNFELIEFLFSEESVVKSNNGYYTNEFIVSFYNNKKLAGSKKQTNG